ncbi:hypothetical protein [Streptomyces sp. MNP-20]|uniref:hypothetical protein n=1 Tax=Streptomyces sp. MNP-20 TaxID=2721165 RepID=UPI0015549E87|nr:hypothetical protein [Streptomyces sp. MNP-20]
MNRRSAIRAGFGVWALGAFVVTMALREPRHTEWEPLTHPRRGPVDPVKCLVCAQLSRRLRKAAADEDRIAVADTVRAMKLHKEFGHPWDRRAPVAPDHRRLKSR